MSIRQREWEARLRLQAFQLEETRRNVGDIELMIADFERKRKELEAAIGYEEQQAGVSDPEDVRYPLAAREMRKRRENLRRSIDDLRKQLEVAVRRVEEARQELDKLREAAARDGVDLIMPVEARTEGFRASV